VKVEYEKGYNRIDRDEDDEILLNQAIEKASKSKEVVLFVGLAENYESEGVDRNNIDFPKNQYW
jgi:beta-glucosidase